MKILIIGIIVLALSVAGVSTYLIRTFAGEENIEGLQKEKATQVKVLVAARPLRPGEAVVPGSLAWQDWPKDFLNEKFVVAEDDKEAEKRIQDFHGGIARGVFHQGEPILAAKIFKSGKPGVLAGMLEGGMRAVSFVVSPQTAVAGFILPGDKVDILLTHSIKWKKKRATRGKESGPDKSRSGGQEPEEATQTKITETIMRNVTVLAINQAVDVAQGGASSMPAQTVTLELTPKQAEMLITARTIGQLSMVLRSLHTPEGANEDLTTTLDVEVSPFFSRFNAMKNARLGTKSSTPAPDPAQKKRKRSLRIYRGTKAAGDGGGATK